MNVNSFFNNYFQGGPAAAGLLILRLLVGFGIMQHGMPKMFKDGQLNAFTWMGPDSPMPGILQAAAAFSEFAGGLAIMAGLLTPVAAFGILATMVVAKFTAHANDPFVAAGGGRSWELAGIYGAVMVALILVGPGAASLDALLAKFALKGNRSQAGRTVTA